MASTDTGKGAKFGTSWSTKEDKKLRKAVLDQGKGHKANWKLVAAKVPGRTPGACQGRWNTVLDPSVDRSPWTPELDAQLLQLYKDPVYNSWSKRAAKLAEGKVGPNGEVMRRSGADACDRYFKLTKAKKGEKETTDAVTQVKWTDETEDMLETPPAIGLPVPAPVVQPTRNQRNRARRTERRKQFVAAKADAAGSSDGEEEPAPAKAKAEKVFTKNAGENKAAGGKRKATFAATSALSKPFKKQRQ